MKRFLPILALLLAACGQAPAPSTSHSSPATAADVEISGTVAKGVPGGDKLLVFVYADLPPGTQPATVEPTMVAGLAPDRSFFIGDVPPGTVTVVFLVDNKSDGVIDPGDPAAVLDDPEHKLGDLQAGDQVTLNDVTVNPASRKAVAASIEVQHASTSPQAVPTPIAQQ